MTIKVARRTLFLLIIAYQLWILFLTFRYPIVGVNVTKSNEGQWIVSRFDSVTIAHATNLHIGDTIVAINGVPASEYSTIHKWNTVDQADLLIISRDGVVREIDVTTLDNPVSYDVFSIVAESFSIFLAYVLYKKIKAGSSKNLSLVFLDIAVVFMSLAGSARGDSVSKFVISSTMMLLPLLFYQFLISYLFEKSTAKLSNKSLKIMYIAVGLILAGSAVHYSVIYKYYNLHIWFKNVTLLLGIVGVGLNLGTLVRVFYMYRKERSNRSVIIKTVFFSLLFSMTPIIIFSFTPKIVLGHEWVNSFYMSWFIFLFPLTFVYLLTTRRLYDIDMIMRRILFTLAIAAVPSLFLTGVMCLLFSHDASIERLVLVFLIILATVTVVLYSLENVTTRLMPTMFPRKYRLQAALKKLSTEVGAISSFREMKDIILADLVETLEVTGGAIAFQYEDHLEIINEGDMTEEKAGSLIRSGEWKEHDQYTCFEVSRQEEYTSYLIIGMKRSGTALGIEEVQWLNLITTYLAVSLENIHLIRKLNRKLQQMASLVPAEEDAMDMAWFRKVMFEFQEKERLRIASDLHDTTMQDLFFLKGKLRNLQNKYIYTKEDGTTLSGLMDYIDIINMNLRQSCFELHPYLLKEIGLVGTLHKLIHSEQAICPFEIELFTSEVAHIERQGMELKRHIFRMVQELLNNAKKHSQAKVVRISIYMHRELLCFLYEDDGVGFEQKDRGPVQEVRASGMGLEQLKTRILALGGQYELETAVGRGVKFSAMLPEKQGKSA